MSTVTVAPTVDPTNIPPRIRLDVTDVGSPTLFATTVLRNDPDGVQRPVRTSDGQPLILTTAGANRTGLIYDYEVPFGGLVSYTTVESPATVSAQVTLDITGVWLIHPGIPALSMPIQLRKGSLDEEVWDVQQAVYQPMNRRFPIVQTDGRRKAPASSVTVDIGSLPELQALRDIVADAGVLLLNVPASLQLGVDTCYIAVGQIHNRRPSDIGSDPYRAVEMPYQVVDRPAGGTQAQRTLDDLLSFASLNALQTAYPTLDAVLAGP